MPRRAAPIPKSRPRAKALWLSVGCPARIRVPQVLQAIWLLIRKYSPEIVLPQKRHRSVPGMCAYSAVANCGTLGLTDVAGAPETTSWLSLILLARVAQVCPEK